MTASGSPVFRPLPGETVYDLTAFKDPATGRIDMSRVPESWLDPLRVVVNETPEGQALIQALAEADVCAVRTASA